MNWKYMICLLSSEKSVPWSYPTPLPLPSPPHSFNHPIPSHPTSRTPPRPPPKYPIQNTIIRRRRPDTAAPTPSLSFRPVRGSSALGRVSWISYPNSDVSKGRVPGEGKGGGRVVLTGRIDGFLAQVPCAAATVADGSFEHFRG